MAVDDLKRLELWARLGFAARGAVYLLLGWIALSTGRALSTDDAVAEVEKLPGSSVLLPLLAAGLFGYALYKLYAAAVDLDGKGDDGKGKLTRLASGLGGLGYLGLSWFAVRVLTGDKGGAQAGQASGSGGSGQETATDVAQAPGGDWLLILAALVVIGVAIAQFVIAYKAKFMDQMPGAPRQVKPLGQLGYAARGLVIAIVGYFLLQAGLDGERMRSFGDALALLRTEHGWLFQIVAAGLVAFGITSLVMARYRRIEDRDMVHDLGRGVDKAKASVKN